MRRKGATIPIEIKIECAKLVASGKIGCATLARQRGFGKQTVRYWVALYKAHGELAFSDKRTHFPEIKSQVLVRYSVKDEPPHSRGINDRGIAVF